MGGSFNLKEKILAIVGAALVFMAAPAMTWAAEPVAQQEETYKSQCYDADGPVIIEGAMDVETDYIASQLSNARREQVGPYKCVSGTYEGIPLVVLKTEQEGANASASTALAIEKFHPRAVINQGTSGGHDPALHTFDIVLGKYTEAADAWVSEPAGKGAGADYKAISYEDGVYSYDSKKGKFTKKRRHTGDSRLMEAARAARGTYKDGNIVEGVISTSNEWNQQVDRILFLHQFTGSSCEEMESNEAAVICQNYDIPFLAIRVLSNTCLHNEEFNPAAGEACQKFVLNVVKEYAAGTLAEKVRA